MIESFVYGTGPAQTVSGAAGAKANSSQLHVVRAQVDREEYQEAED